MLETSQKFHDTMERLLVTFEGGQCVGRRVYFSSHSGSSSACYSKPLMNAAFLTILCMLKYLHRKTLKKIEVVSPQSIVLRLEDDILLACSYQIIDFIANIYVFALTPPKSGMQLQGRAVMCIEKSCSIIRDSLAGGWLGQSTLDVDETCLLGDHLRDIICQDTKEGEKKDDEDHEDIYLSLTLEEIWWLEGTTSAMTRKDPFSFELWFGSPAINEEGEELEDSEELIIPPSHHLLMTLLTLSRACYSIGCLLLEDHHKIRRILNDKWKNWREKWEEIISESYTTQEETKDSEGLNIDSQIDSQTRSIDEKTLCELRELCVNYYRDLITIIRENLEKPGRKETSNSMMTTAVSIITHISYLIATSSTTISSDEIENSLLYSEGLPNIIAPSDTNRRIGRYFCWDSTSNFNYKPSLSYARALLIQCEIIRCVFEGDSGPTILSFKNGASIVTSHGIRIIFRFESWEEEVESNDFDDIDEQSCEVLNQYITSFEVWISTLNLPSNLLSNPTLDDDVYKTTKSLTESLYFLSSSIINPRGIQQQNSCNLSTYCLNPEYDEISSQNQVLEDKIHIDDISEESKITKEQAQKYLLGSY